MRIPVEIDTTEDRLAFDLFEATTLAVGISVGVPGPAVLTFRGLRKKDPPGAGILRLEVGFEPGSSVGQAAAWLCQRIAGRVSALRIGDAGVDVDPEKVERALARLIG